MIIYNITYYYEYMCAYIFYVYIHLCAHAFFYIYLEESSQNTDCERLIARHGFENKVRFLL